MGETPPEKKQRIETTEDILQVLADSLPRSLLTSSSSSSTDNLSLFDSAYPSFTLSMSSSSASSTSSSPSVSSTVVSTPRKKRLVASYDDPDCKGKELNTTCTGMGVTAPGICGACERFHIPVSRLRVFSVVTVPRHRYRHTFNLPAYRTLVAFSSVIEAEQAQKAESRLTEYEASPYLSFSFEKGPDVPCELFTFCRTCKRFQLVHRDAKTKKNTHGCCQWNNEAKALKTGKMDPRVAVTHLVPTIALPSARVLGASTALESVATVVETKSPRLEEQTPHASRAGPLPTRLVSGMWLMNPLAYRRTWLPTGDDTFILSVSANDARIPRLDRTSLCVQVAGVEVPYKADARTIMISLPAAFFSIDRLPHLSRMNLPSAVPSFEGWFDLQESDDEKDSGATSAVFPDHSQLLKIVTELVVGLRPAAQHALVVVVLRALTHGFGAEEESVRSHRQSAFLSAYSAAQRALPFDPTPLHSVMVDLLQAVYCYYAIYHHDDSDYYTGVLEILDFLLILGKQGRIAFQRIVQMEVGSSSGRAYVFSFDRPTTTHPEAKHVEIVVPPTTFWSITSEGTLNVMDPPPPSNVGFFSTRSLPLSALSGGKSRTTLVDMCLDKPTSTPAATIGELRWASDGSLVWIHASSLASLLGWTVEFGSILASMTSHMDPTGVRIINDTLYIHIRSIPWLLQARGRIRGLRHHHMEALRSCLTNVSTLPSSITLPLPSLDEWQNLIWASVSVGEGKAASRVEWKWTVAADVEKAIATHALRKDQETWFLSMAAVRKEAEGKRSGHQSIWLGLISESIGLPMNDTWTRSSKVGWSHSSSVETATSSLSSPGLLELSIAAESAPHVGKPVGTASPPKIIGRAEHADSNKSTTSVSSMASGVILDVP